MKNNEESLQGHETPQKLSDFITHLVLGPRHNKSNSINIKIVSLSHSIINCVSRSHIKSTTSVGLGLAIKTLTGCKKILTLLNKLGFRISYHVTEEVETGLAYAVSAQNSVLPIGLIPQKPYLCTGVAFDNFDRLIETITGKDTLHDTNGIVYQNFLQNNDGIDGHQNQKPNLESAVALSRESLKRRTFDNYVDRCTYISLRKVP